MHAWACSPLSFAWRYDDVVSERLRQYPHNYCIPSAIVTKLRQTTEHRQWNTFKKSISRPCKWRAQELPDSLYGCRKQHYYFFLCSLPLLQIVMHSHHHKPFQQLLHLRGMTQQEHQKYHHHHQEQLVYTPINSTLQNQHSIYSPSVKYGPMHCYATTH